jgi:MFS transporter, FHS family, Na+ dependent glucose transporter 1
MNSSLLKQKNNWPQTAAYFAALASFGAMVASWGPLLPHIAAQTQTDMGSIGMVFSARAVGVFFGSLLGGRIYDRLPGHPLLGGALLVLACTFTLVPFINTFWLLLLLIVIMGLAAGMVISGSNTLLVWVHPKNTASWINSMNFCNATGSFLAPIVITAILTAVGEVRWAFWALALFIGGAGVYALSVSSPKINKEQNESTKDGRIPLKVILPFALVFLLYVSAEVSFGGWLYTYTITLHPQEIAGAGLLTSAFWASIALGRLAAIPLSTRLRPRTILLIDFAGALTSLIAILTLSRYLPVLWVATIGFGLCMASIFPTWMAFSGRRIKITGRVSGIFYAATAVGAMTFPALCGWAFDASGPRATMFVILSALLMAVIIYAIVRRTQPGQITE